MRRHRHEVGRLQDGVGRGGGLRASGSRSACRTRAPRRRETVTVRTHFIQWFPAQPGTTSRTGPPWSTGSGSPFIAVASRVSGWRAFSSGMLRKKSGRLRRRRAVGAEEVDVRGSAARARARSRTSASRTPVHSALPTAPRSQPTPGTLGRKFARPLPEHWSTAVTVTRANPARSSGLKLNGRFDQPADLDRPGRRPDGRRAEMAADEEQVVGREPAVEGRDGRLQVERAAVPDDQAGPVRFGGARSTRGPARIGQLPAAAANRPVVLSQARRVKLGPVGGGSSRAIRPVVGPETGPNAWPRGD